MAKTTKVNWSLVCPSGLTADTSPSLLAVFEHKRYLFNCGEAVPRALIEINAGFKKTENIFVTRADSEAAGGLPGCVLSQAGAGSTSVRITGPENIEHFLASSRFAFRRDTMKLTTVIASNEDQPCFTDENVTVYAYPGESSRGVKRKRDDEPTSTLAQLAQALGFSPSNLSGEAADEWRRAVLSDMFPGSAKTRSRIFFPTPAWLVRQLPPPRTTTSTALSYLVLGPPIRGKFLPEKAKALGIKPGKKFGLLADGQSVTADDGTIVQPSDVTLPGTPASAFALFDLPDKKALDQAATTAKKMRDQVEKRGAALKVVYLWLGPDMLFDPAFDELAKALGDVKQVIAAPETTPNLISNSLQALLQLRLARLDPSTFRIPQYSLEGVFKLPNEGAEHWSAPHRELMAGAYDPGEAMLPPRRFNFPVPSEQSLAAEAQLKGKLSGPNAREIYAKAEVAWKKYLELSKESVKTLQAVEVPSPRPGDDVLVTPLGTGSSTASMYRSVSSTLVQIPDLGALLLDCGEGTIGQLLRRFGRQETASILGSLQFIFISHMHADHNGGLVRLLAYRKQAGVSTPMTISCPLPLQYTLRDHAAIEDLGLDNVELITNAIAPFEVAGLGLSHVLPVEVRHRALNCYGIAITSQDGWKIVYSGDTMPCESLVRHGKDADLLIHEATMDDSMADSAELKAHSTFGQALDVGTRMNARNVLLTHFSQRYPKLPGNAGKLKSTPLNVALAFDLMSIRIGDFYKFRHWIPAMNELFKELTLPGAYDVEEMVVESED